MKNLTDWIKQHQVTAFFIFTLTFTFGLGIPALALMNTIQGSLQMIGGVLGIVAVFGPVLSGMAVTRITAPLKDQNNRKARWIMFLAVWIVAWIALALWVKGGIPSENGPGLGPILVLTAPIALLPAYVVSSAFSRVGSLRSYLSTLVKPRGNIAWYLVAFFTFPVIHLLGNVFTNLAAGRPCLANFAGATTGLIGIAVLEFIKVFFWSGGINEESGWRGFALPRLQSKLTPIMAGLIIWAVHTIWELLGDVFTDVFSGGDISWPAMSRLVWMPCWTILFIWVYNRTKGSILAPVIFHASMNMMNPLMGILPTTTAGTILLACFAFFAVVSDRMWKKLPSDHPAVYREPVLDG